MLLTKLGLAAALLPLLASILGIPAQSISSSLTLRNPPGDGTCETYNFRGWCGVPDNTNGCWDDGCSAFNVGAACHCDEPHRMSTRWGCSEGSFCDRIKESGCQGEPGDIEGDLPIDDSNPLIKWCNAGNQIPAQSIVAGTVGGTMVYVCNYLDKEIGCAYRNEVIAGMDCEIDLCGNGHPGWAFSRDWNKLYGMHVNGSSEVCTNILCTDPLYIDENGEIHGKSCLDELANLPSDGNGN